ncbi:hypothetical protein [Vibrio methylphosphonaticus]|uniref:hypothetical protein n=1 Tax=Vibrio methylphosphonaticus TaxID=2946866 RepID=UPI00202A0A14|nr:hypothetical protein [Vibrio methylphosphonaticus]MCL9777539.1 hypothetical protein [Vibrio methylphosphonaticus]
MINFEKIAPYLEDPLVLIGFVVFLLFSFCRYLIKQGIFPQLKQKGAITILKLILSYGFIIGIVIIGLGFGLKYNELSKSEQKRAISLIYSEIEANKHVVSELNKNTTTLSNTSKTISNILRDEQFKILSGLFPKKNYIENVKSDELPNLYNEKMDWLENSGLLNDSEEVRKYQEVCAAIVRTVDKTQTTLESLADLNGKRYVVSDSAWKANLDVIRKIDIIDVTELAKLYSKMGELRSVYDRVANIVPEYNSNIKSFCSTELPSKPELSATLALERITFALIESYQKKLNELTVDINDVLARLQNV